MVGGSMAPQIETKHVGGEPRRARSLLRCARRLASGVAGAGTAACLGKEWRRQSCGEAGGSGGGAGMKLLGGASLPLPGDDGDGERI
jgi:hypothetical protein